LSQLEVWAEWPADEVARVTGAGGAPPGPESLRATPSGPRGAPRPAMARKLKGRGARVRHGAQTRANLKTPLFFLLWILQHDPKLVEATPP